MVQRDVDGVNEPTRSPHDSSTPQESTDEDVSELLARCRAGDQEASATLFRRYMDRLIALVRDRLSQRFGSRMDPEDVLQSAYRSFFNGLGNGKFAVERADELWGLLAAITLNKLHRRIAYHTAKKRTPQREQRPADKDQELAGYPELIAELPTPSEAVEVVEILEQVMSRLSPIERKVLELRLDSYSYEEIALQISRTDRTVRRAMHKLRLEFQRHLMENSAV